jgi:tetratricopeptide (TPR) repeat protein
MQALPRRKGEAKFILFDRSPKGCDLPQEWRHSNSGVHFFGCLPKDDAYVDVHISKVFFKEADRPAFDMLLDSFHAVPREVSNTPVPVGNSVQLFQEGSRYFIERQYREAIPAYQKALDIEKSTPMLEKNYWLALIDNLSMAYGITGDLASAKSTLSYGVSKDPDYPLFYYNLACVAAEKGDVHDTEKFLRLAYDRRNNVIQGETFPDARADDSFQKLLIQDEFRQFANSLYGTRQ